MESSPSWLENIQCSPLWSVLLTANLLGSIYGLIDVTHLTSALSFHSVAYIFKGELYMTHSTHDWFIDWPPATSVPDIKYLPSVILKLKFKAVRCWNKTHKGCRLLFWSHIWKVTQHNKWHHTVICASSIISTGLRAPCWRSKSSPATHHLPSREYTEPPALPSNSSNTVGLFWPFIIN